MAVRNIIGKPVAGANFFGREHELDDLKRITEEEHVLLLAPRRVGKTSLLLALQAETNKTDGTSSSYVSVAPAEGTTDRGNQSRRRWSNSWHRSAFRWIRVAGGCQSSRREHPSRRFAVAYPHRRAADPRPDHRPLGPLGSEGSLLPAVVQRPPPIARCARKTPIRARRLGGPG